MTRQLLKIIIILAMISCSSGKKCITKNILEVDTFENDFGRRFDVKYFVDEIVCQKYDTSYVLNGKYELFTTEGVLMQSSFFINGKLNGESRDYHSNGKIKMISEYRNDSLVGIKIIYGNNSEVLDTNILSNGSGKYREYYSNNQLACEYHLAKGLKEGIDVTYDSTGVKIAEGHYKNGLKNGNFLFYYSNKNIATKCQFQKDILVGEYFDYYKSGILKTKVNYKYPPYSHSDSLLIRLIPIDDDNILNLLDSFDPGDYLKGIKVGNETNYDENGKEIKN